MARYNKLIAALAALTLYVLAQLLGLDLGEVGADIDGDTLLHGVIAALSVFFAPKNE